MMGLMVIKTFGKKCKTKDATIQCSAEGHVSHVYADRMSSRPLGWSRTGANKMSQLRIYHYNKGSMLDLVRYQKVEERQSMDECYTFSCSDISNMISKRKQELGSFADMPVYTIPYTHIKKIAYLRSCIWGL